MNGTWDLSILYTGFDDPAFEADTKRMDAAIEELSALASKGSVKQFFFDDYSDDDPALLVWMDDGLLYRVSL